MIRQIMRDPMFLGMKSEEATKADMNVAEDLRDTLAANRDQFSVFKFTNRL